MQLSTIPTKEELFAYLKEEKTFPTHYNNDKMEKVYVLLNLQGKRYAILNSIPVSSIYVIDKSHFHNHVSGTSVFSVRVCDDVASLFLDFNIPNATINFAIPSGSELARTPEQYGFYNSRDKEYVVPLTSNHSNLKIVGEPLV